MELVNTPHNILKSIKTCQILASLYVLWLFFLKNAKFQKVQRSSVKARRIKKNIHLTFLC